MNIIKNFPTRIGFLCDILFHNKRLPDREPRDAIHHDGLSSGLWAIKWLLKYHCDVQLYGDVLIQYDPHFCKNEKVNSLKHDELLY